VFCACPFPLLALFGCWTDVSDHALSLEILFRPLCFAMTLRVCFAMTLRVCYSFSWIARLLRDDALRLLRDDALRLLRDDLIFSPVLLIFLGLLPGSDFDSAVSVSTEASFSRRYCACFSSMRIFYVISTEICVLRSV
jgi:hypothetical protein